MSPEQQRIKIAEACGWKIIDFNRGDKLPDVVPSKTTYWDKERKYKPYPAIPDYLNDLNAMHEVEATLDCVQQFAYAAYLYYGEPHEHAWDQVAAFEIAHATAAQRAEAFLKTLNLWEES